MDESAFPRSALAAFSPCEILKGNNDYMLYNDMYVRGKLMEVMAFSFFFFFYCWAGWWGFLFHYQDKVTTGFGRVLGFGMEGWVCCTILWLQVKII